MRPTIIRTAILAAAVVGCATLGTVGASPDPELRFDQALLALEAGDLEQADAHLRWVWENHWNEPIGKRALLVLTAVELDPRNLQRRTDAAAEMSSLVLDLADTPTWMAPIAKTFYLLSLELGVNEDLITRLIAQRENITGLPQLPGSSVQTRIDALRTERDSLGRRVQTLQQTIAARDRVIQEKDQELERIRRALTGGRGGGGGGGGDR